MEIKIIPYGQEVVGWTHHSKVDIGDIVQLKSGDWTWPGYTYAFEDLWGEKLDGFHNEYGDRIRPYKDGLYGNIWRVVNFYVHSWYNIILCHLQDCFGRNLLASENGLEIIKKRYKGEPKTMVLGQRRR